MRQPTEHPALPQLQQQLEQGKLSRREFLRFATLLGVSATTAYGWAGLALAENPATDLPKGGRVRISMRLGEVKNPHTISETFSANVIMPVCEHLVRTGHDNITRPHLLESWAASDDLRTWTLKLRPGITWHNGRPFTTADVDWNLRHVLDPATGSSVLGLMEGYMLSKNGDSTELWDANAIEIVDDLTLVLNLKVPQVAVPEHLFHYPLMMLDPEEGGEFGVGSNGTGPFTLTEYVVGTRATLSARDRYWGDGPYLDELQYIDLGEEAGAVVGAIQSGQVDGLFQGDISQLDAFQAMDHVQIYTAVSADTGVARVQVDRPEFSDPRVRKAMRLAVNNQPVLDTALRGLGSVAEHHHVCPIHPEYAPLPTMERDVEGAKALLAEAGFPDGVDFQITCKKEPAWELAAVQMLVEQWREANIRVAINLLPSPQYWEVWDKAPFGFTGWSHRPLGVMVLGLAYRSGAPWNESHYANPEFDELLVQAEGTLDIDQRKAIMAKIQQIMQEDGPIIQPVWRSMMVGYNKRVLNFAMHPTMFIFAETLAVEPS